MGGYFEGLSRLDEHLGMGTIRTFSSQLVDTLGRRTG